MTTSDSGFEMVELKDDGTRQLFHRYVDISAEALAADLAQLLNRAAALGIVVSKVDEYDGTRYTVEWGYAGEWKFVEVEWGLDGQTWVKRDQRA